MLEHIKYMMCKELNRKRTNIKREATYKCDTCQACFYYPAKLKVWPGGSTTSAMLIECALCAGHSSRLDTHRLCAVRWSLQQTRYS
jgi:hypothetical protein